MLNEVAIPTVEPCNIEIYRIACYI